MAEEREVHEDWVQKLVRDYQDAITRGAYEGIYRLDDGALGTVMAEQARACVHAFTRLYGIGEDLDLDSFLEKMKTGGASRVNIQREGDTILWEELHQGQCMCPFVRRNVIPLRPALCVCAVHWLRMLIEPVAQRPVRVEMVDSVAQGGENCVFRIHLGR